MKDKFEQLMKEKLGHHEVTVNPALWKAVSSSAGISSSAWGLGAWLGLFSGLLVLMASALYFILPSEKPHHAPSKGSSHLAPRRNKERVAMVDINSRPQEPIKAEKPQKSKDNEKGTQPIKGIFIATAQEGILQLDLHSEDVTINISNKKDADTTGVLPIARTQKAETQWVEQASILNPLVPEEEKEKIQETQTIAMPNAITPNGDGVNDVLSLQCGDLHDFSVVVLDAQNKVVYQANSTTFEWNGTLLNGDPAPQGVYSYYYTAKDKNGIWQHQFSTLTLLR